MSSVRRGLEAIASEPANIPVVRRFKLFFLAVAGVPTAVYFVVYGTLRYLVFKEFIHLKLSSLSIAAGICAVCAINILISLYALAAVLEDVGQKKLAAEESYVDRGGDGSDSGSDGGSDDRLTSSLRPKIE